MPWHSNCETRHVTRPVAFYRTVIVTLRRAGLPFLVGGAYAMARHTGIDRPTKDLDLMIRPRDWPAAARALRRAGIHTRLVFPHWLGKAVDGTAEVDVIFSSGNALTDVDEACFARAAPARVLGFRLPVCAAEDLLWTKAFVMERERFDGADVLHLILRSGRSFDWPHLLARFRGHERVLLAHVTLFGYVYPTESDVIPRWVVRRLLAAPIAPAVPGVRVCRGTLLSREQYLVDVRAWGFADARLPPFGHLTPRAQLIWTRAIGTTWPPARRRAPAV
jgi:hypothetical protein